MERHSRPGSPCALSSLDFAGWIPHSGAVADQRRNIGKTKAPELRLECAMDDRLWIWHLIFGYPGAMNDLSVLDCFPLFAKVKAGTWQVHKPKAKVKAGTRQVYKPKANMAESIIDMVLLGGGWDIPRLSNISQYHSVTASNE